MWGLNCWKFPRILLLNASTAMFKLLFSVLDNLKFSQSRYSYSGFWFLLLVLGIMFFLLFLLVVWQFCMNAGSESRMEENIFLKAHHILTKFDLQEEALQWILAQFHSDSCTANQKWKYPKAKTVKEEKKKKENSFETTFNSYDALYI